MVRNGKLWIRVLVYVVLFCSADTLLFGSNKDTRFILLRYLSEATVVVILLAKLFFKDRMTAGVREVVFGSMVLLVLCSCIVNDDIRPGYLYIIMLLALGILLTKTILFEDFVDCFCRYVRFLAVVSILFFLFYIFCNELVRMLPVVTNTADRQSYTMLLASMPTEFYRNQYRNSGIFREPGVFQMYLIWALMFELFRKEKLSVVNCGICVVAILTTFSTTAYIAAAILLLCYFIKRGDYKDWVIRGFLFFGGGFALLYIIQYTELLSPSGIIFGKFTEANNPSVAARWASVVVNLIMICRSVLLGNGLTFLNEEYNNYAVKYLQTEVSDNTNMILYLMASLGVVFGGLFLLGLWKFCGRLSGGRLLRLGFLSIFVVLFIGENLVFSPITYIFVFYGFEKWRNELGTRNSYENNLVM